MTEQIVKLQPRLLRDHDTLRYQKAVDPDTGELVGYARWRLSDNRSESASGEPEWADARMAKVSAEKKTELETKAAGAWWDPHTNVDDLDEDNSEVRERVMAGQPHIGEFIQFLFLKVFSLTCSCNLYY